MFSDNPNVRAAYLIDPVDNTQYQPESADNPSAEKALKASGKAVGMSGAGVIGPCNPDGGNYKVICLLVSDLSSSFGPGGLKDGSVC